MGSQLINIVLADDHPVIRKGIKSLLKTETDFNIIGEAGNGAEAVELVTRLQPDILVLDIMMPGLNGLEVTRELKIKCPHTAIVILSMHSHDAYVIEALRSGAKAYILKDSFTDDLIRGLKEVISGHVFLSSPLSERAIQIYTRDIPLPKYLT
jgi:two-component system response regulator NreC